MHKRLADKHGIIGMHVFTYKIIDDTFEDDLFNKITTQVHTYPKFEHACINMHI